MRVLTPVVLLLSVAWCALYSPAHALKPSSSALTDLIHLKPPSVEPSANSTWCKDCLVFLTLAKEVAEGRLVRDLGEFLADEYCLVNHGGLGYSCRGNWACHDMCDNIVKLFGPEVVDIAAQLVLDPPRDCASLGFCPKPNDTIVPFNPPPASPASREELAVYAPSTASTPYRIVHVSDIHWDPEYLIGGNADCGEPLCCRVAQGPGHTHNTTCGAFGDHAGDTPLSLLKGLLQAIADVNPDFVFATGDDPPHNVWNQTEEFNTGVSVNMSDLWRQYWPGIPVFPGLGNHNGLPINQFHTDPSKDADWLYHPLADAYSTWLPESALETFRTAGYYTMAFPGRSNWRAVVLNMGLHVSENFWTLLNHDLNLGNMSDWLEATLQHAADNQETVFILGHYPLNDKSYWSNWLEGRFEPLLRQYKDIIRGMFWGHTHKAQVQLTWNNDTTEPILASYVVAAPTPFGGVNPTFRVYDVDRDSGVVLDYHDYTVDLKGQGFEHNLFPTTSPEWNYAYSAKSAYNLTSLSPQEWRRMADAMRTNDQLFHSWELNYHSGNAEEADFSQHERQRRICDILGGNAQLVKRCMAGNLTVVAE